MPESRSSHSRSVQSSAAAARRRAAPPRRGLLWAGVVVVCVGLLALAVHFAFGMWAWSAFVFASVAAAIGLYFGVTACGAWTETPLLEMARPRNHRYFGGGRAIARHVAFLAVWCTAISMYTLVLVYFVRVGIIQLEGQWVERFGGQLPSLTEPGGRLGMTIVIAFLLCRATIRVERVLAARRGEELSLDDGSLLDEPREQHAGLLKLAIVRIMIVFLVPIYKELRRKSGLMESAAHALLMRDFGYDALTRAGQILIERYDHRAVRELREQLAATRFPDEHDKEVEVHAGLVASALYELHGYYGARERIRAYNATVYARERDSQQSELRTAPRLTRNAQAVALIVSCSKHGPRRAQLLDYREDARGLGVVTERCACLDEADELAFELNHKPFVGEIRHRSAGSQDEQALRLGVLLQDATARAALSELQRCLRPELPGGVF